MVVALRGTAAAWWSFMGHGQGIMHTPPMPAAGKGAPSGATAVSGIPEYPVTLQHGPPKDLDKYIDNPGRW